MQRARGANAGRPVDAGYGVSYFVRYRLSWLVAACGEVFGCFGRVLVACDREQLLLQSSFDFICSLCYTMKVFVVVI